MHWWQEITSLGGLAFTGPIALFIALFLLTGRQPGSALAWCLIFGGAMLAVMATKIAFLGWGFGIRPIQFAGLSGHAARAAAVFPVALYLLFQHERTGLRNGAVGFGLLCAALVAVSRVKVHAHPVSEAALGFAAGVATAGAFLALLQRAPRVRLSPWLVAACIGVLLLRPARDPVDSEKWMAVSAMALSGHDRVYQRWSWQLASAPFTVQCRPPETARGYICS